jgi:hypothetical protein
MPFIMLTLRADGCCRNTFINLKNEKMKKMIFISLLAGGSLFASCGGKKTSKKDLLNDVNEMCKCFIAGKNDSKKYMECSAENEKMREKYKSDNEALTKYDAGLKNCIEGK